MRRAVWPRSGNRRSASTRSAADIDGWQSWHRQTPDGAVESGQRVMLTAPVVGFTDDGARALGRVYWKEVERSTFRLVRSHGASGTRLSLVGGWPTLLRFGEPELEVSPSSVVCRYPIEGGVLVRRPSGEISFAQDAARGLELRSSIRGFYPMLAARTGKPGWTGALYEQLQSRAHVAISRRYFARLLRDARLEGARR